MKQIANIFLLLSLILSITFGAVSKIGSKDFVKQKQMRKVEPTPTQTVTNPSTIPHTQYDLRNGAVFTLVDSSQNGYGMVASQTRPIYVNDEGWIIAYRQFHAPGESHGRLGAAYSEDGETWSQPYANLNNSMAQARYPSALGNGDYPFIIWNEYSVNWAADCLTCPDDNIVTSEYGGRPFYSYDGLGWDYGSWENPIGVDPAYSGGKDLWVGSATHSVDSDGMEYFNAVYNDWTRNLSYFFHSEVYEDGLIIFEQETVVINEQADLLPGDAAGSYNASPTLSMNNDGIGAMGIVGLWPTDDNGVDCNPNTEENPNPGDCYHTPIFKMTYDHGASWSDYYSVTNDVWEDLITTFDQYYDPCADTTEVMRDAWAYYDFDLKVDAAGNPHYVISVLPGDDAGYSYFSNGDGSDNGSGFYHFTINKDYLDNPGPINSPTGWNYSRVVSGHDSFPYASPDGESLVNMLQPSIAFSTEDPNVMWVVTNMMVSGAADPDTVDPDDPNDCAVDAVFDSYPEASKEILVSKSTDGGLTWWNPLNATDTPDWSNGGLDCPTTVFTQGWCSPEEEYPHAFQWGTDDRVYLMYQMPNWEFNEIDEPLGADHMNYVYAGYAEITTNSEPDYPADDSGCSLTGDANDDGTLNILDVVGSVNFILGIGTLASEVCADFNGDDTINILDVVGMVNCILGIGSCGDALGRIDDATSATILNNDGQVILATDGYVGAVQMTIAHDAEFTIELGDAFIAKADTKGRNTTLIVVNPESDVLFTAQGNFAITNVEATNSVSFINVVQADKFALMSTYPNPFNPETTISYELFSNSNVSLIVYNMLGQQVNILANGFMNAGSYTAVWSGLDAAGHEMASGIYMFKLITDNQVVTNKVTLLR